MEKRSGVVAALLVILGAPLVVGAQPRKPTKPTLPAPSASAPAAPTAPAVDANLEAAKDFFRKGNAELEAGRNDRALDYFLQSRALVPSVANTNNAALALENLGRIDEALDLYEELLLTFATRLTSDERTSVSNKVAKLRGMVGQIEVSANVDGLLVIDGRRRGNVPAAAPFRVPAGSHTVRVIKDGHTPAEVTLTVAAGQSVRADLKLEILSAAGRLSVTDTSGAPDVEVLIDGAPLGVAPWEGTLGPGRHLVALRGKDVGTAPTVVTVLAGQTVRSELRSVRLGPRLNVMFEPATAIVSIDGVEVGPGRWQGRLPDGEHTFEAREEGYLPAEERIGIDRTELSVQLKVNEGHPRWRQAGGKWQLGAVLGLSFASGLGSRAEEACPGSCPRAPGAEGGLVAGRLSYHLRNGLFFEGLVGVLQVERSFQRKVENAVGRYTLDDELSLRGPVVQLGVGYQLPLSARLRGVGGLGVGFFSAKANDPVTGQLEAGGSTTPVTVDQSGKSVRGAAIYLAPRLGVDLNVSRRLRLGLGLSAMVFLLDGPSFPHGETTPTTPGCSQGSTSASCARGTTAFSSERSYSRFVLWTPQASLGWEFLAMLTRFMAMPKRSRSRAAWPLSLLGVTLATSAPGLADPSPPQAAPRDDAALASLRERFPRELGRRPEVPLRLGLRGLSSQRFALAAGSLAVEASLLGAREVTALRDGDLLSFRGAAPGGGDLLVRAAGGAVEDFLSLPQPLATPEVRYELRLDGVAGLRLVGNTLEFLDAAGAPQLRVAPPYLVDAHHHTHPATLSIEQCDVDRDSRPPWGRPTTPPGPGACVLRVAWSDHNVAYPALLDPKWEVTKDPGSNQLYMITARALPALVPFGDEVAVIGGLTGTTDNPATTDQVEYFDPATRTFAQGPSLPGPRYGHTATPLPGGGVLVTGGFAQPQPPHVAASGNPAALGEVLILEPGATDWKAGPPLGAARGFHTATVIEGGRVLVLGGLDQKQSSSQAESYDPFGGKWNGVAPMTDGTKQIGRHTHTATLLPDGRVLVAGGLTQTPADPGAGGPVTGQGAALLFQPTGASGSPWKPTALLTQGRAGHSAHLLRNGQVVLAGGCGSAPSFASGGGGCAPIDALSVFTPSSEQGSWTALAGPPPLPTDPVENPSPLGLAGPSVAGLRNGWLLLAGGRDGDQDDLKVTAALRPPGATDTTAGDPSSPVAGWQWAYNPFERPTDFPSQSFATAFIDQSGSVLRLGGLSGKTIIKDAEYLSFLPHGEGCTPDKAIECGSGVCVSGVCCDRPCDGPCVSCLQQDTNLGQDGLCGVHVAREGKECKQVSQCQTSGSLTQSVDRGVCHNGDCQDALQECTSYQACNAQAEGPSCSDRCDNVAQCAPGLFCQPQRNQPDAKICCGASCAGTSCDQAEVGLLVGACDPLSHTCETDYFYCKGYACDPVSKACRASCTDDAQCAKGTHFCDSTGKCLPRSPGGSACQQGSECASGSCLDGVCCNTACEPTCHSCAQAIHQGNNGACLPVPENTEHNGECLRDTANPCGLNGLCGLGKCAFAGEQIPCGALGDRQCLNNKDLRSLYCDGQGQCGTSQQDKSCGTFSCLDGDCRKSCQTTAQCADDNECVKQVCVSPAPQRCQGENQVVRACVEGTCNPEVTRPCDRGFACRDQGLCPTKCSDDSWCRDGFKCDGTGACVPIATCIPNTNKIRLADNSEVDCLPNHRCTDERPDRCTQAACLSSDDCQETFVCHESGRCLPAARPSLDDADCLCSQPGRPSPLAPGAVALLLATAALRRRSRRAGS